MSLISAIFF
jgi:hypothetical protein